MLDIPANLVKTAPWAASPSAEFAAILVDSAEVRSNADVLSLTCNKSANFLFKCEGDKCEGDKCDEYE